jgi:biotin carboxyl carrier protein
MAKKDKIEDVQEVQDVTTEVKESKLPKIRKVKNPKDVVEVVKEKKERKPREKKEKEAEKEVVDDSEMPPGIYFSEVPSEVSLVEVGDRVREGDLIITPTSLKKNSYDLGLNARVALMPYYGFNNEDAIIFSSSW